MLPISEIIIDAFCHATEDIEKVKTAMLNFIPAPLRSKANIIETILEGYYGNIISGLKIRIIDEEIIRSFLSFLRDNLSDYDKRLLFETFDLRIDKSNIVYLRFDKGAAYKGVYILSDGSDTIRTALRFRVNRKLIKNICKDFGLIIEV